MQHITLSCSASVDISIISAKCPIERLLSQELDYVHKIYILLMYTMNCILYVFLISFIINKYDFDFLCVCVFPIEI